MYLASEMLLDLWKSMDSSELQHGHIQGDVLINIRKYIIRWERNTLHYCNVIHNESCMGVLITTFRLKCSDVTV